MKKRFLAMFMASAMTLSLAACSGNTDVETTDDTTDDTLEDATNTGNAGADNGNYTVGICQLAPHVALDAATAGFKEAIEAALPGMVTFEEENAAGDSATCATIINGFVANDVDLILANATPALQAAAAATNTIPILGTSITTYDAALGLSNFNGTVGTNVSGTSDLAPLDQQAAMLKEWLPDAQNIGLIYCSAEANSQYQIDTVQKYLEDLGCTCTQYPFSDTNDMASVVQSAVNANDALYVPTDNTIANNTGVVDNICRPAGIPVIAGEEGICAGCGIATLSISYHDLGITTGEMAVKILTGESDVSTMPIEYAPQFTKKYNPTICEALNLTPPAGYEAIS